MFLVAMVIITIGEMFVSPTGQAIVARLAPEDMRGRYMAIFGFSWVIPMAVGPLLAGMVMDNFNPNWVWYAAGILGIASAGAFYLLEMQVNKTRWAVVDERLDVLEKVEDGVITAEEAAALLQSISEGKWARLATDVPLRARRHMNIRVSEIETNTMNIDLHLPVGLVNMVMDTGGRLSSDLDYQEEQEIQRVISMRDVGEGVVRTSEGDGKRVEISIHEEGSDDSD
jgi:hypothetical protein